MDKSILDSDHARLHAATCRLPLKGDLTIGVWAARNTLLDRALRRLSRSQRMLGAPRAGGEIADDAEGFGRLACGTLARFEGPAKRAG